MSDKNMIIAVDFGSTHTTMIAAEVVDDRVKVLSVVHGDDKEELVQNANDTLPTLPLKQTTLFRSRVQNGIVVQATDLSHQIIKMTKSMNDSLHLKKSERIKSMYVCINAKTMKCVKHTVMRSFSRSFEITDALLSEMENECRQSLTQDTIEVYHIIAVDYELDNKHFTTPPQQKGRNLQVTYHAVTGSKKIGKNIYEIFNRTAEIDFKNYKPLSMESIAEAVLSQEECDDGVALINFGATTTTLALYLNGQLETLLVVPLGSYNITKDLQSLEISESYAEKLKIKFGIAMESLVEQDPTIKIPSMIPNDPDVEVLKSYVAKIIEARLNEIFALIFEILKNNKNKIETGIVLTGGGSKLRGIDVFIEKKTGIKTTFGNHADKLTKNTDKKFADPFYTQLIGMCLLINNYREENPYSDTDVFILWKERLKELREKIKNTIVAKIPSLLSNDDNPI
ncbi:MAG: cell division protein FtsA [Paludibacter sp.]|nr:cell division protein FtsA [Paludibacter sp.]